MWLHFSYTYVPILDNSLSALEQKSAIRDYTHSGDRFNFFKSSTLLWHDNFSFLVKDVNT